MRLRVRLGIRYVSDRDSVRVETEPIWLAAMYEPLAVWIRGAWVVGITEENNWESGDIWLQQAESKYQVLPETTEETLSEVDRNYLTMVKTNGLNSLTETDDRERFEGKEGYEGSSLAIVATKWLTGLGRMPDWPGLGGLVGQL
jgi:hypothetical protein